MVVYYLPSGFTSIVVSHGNSKSARPFLPTLPSNSVDIKKKCTRSGPKEVVSGIDCAVGGVMDALTSTSTSAAKSHAFGVILTL